MWPAGSRAPTEALQAVFLVRLYRLMSRSRSPEFHRSRAREQPPRAAASPRWPRILGWSDTLTPVEKRLRAYLIDLAREDEDWLRPCGRVAEDTDPEHDPNDRRYARLKKRLFHISSYEVEHGRPMLSALVVRSADYRPGKGMYELARGLGRLKAEDADLEWRNVEIEELRRYWAA